MLATPLEFLPSFSRQTEASGRGRCFRHVADHSPQLDPRAGQGFLPWVPRVQIPHDFTMGAGAGAGAGAGVVPRVTYIIGTPGTGRHEGRGLPCENLVAIGPRRDGEGTPCHTSWVTTWKGQGEGLGKGATGAAAGSRAVRSNAGIVRGGEYLHPSDAVR